MALRGVVALHHNEVPQLHTVRALKLIIGMSKQSLLTDTQLWHNKRQLVLLKNGAEKSDIPLWRQQDILVICM